MSELGGTNPELASEERLEQVLDVVFKKRLRKDLPKQEVVRCLSKLFLQLFTESGLSSRKPQAFEIVLPGGSANEVIGIVLAVEALGINQPHITCIERRTMLVNGEPLDRVMLREAFGRKLQVGSSTINADFIVGSDASDPRYKAGLSGADAIMVFIGNMQTDMGTVLSNWSTLGQEAGKPFLLAVTATNVQGEREAIAYLFDRSRQQGELAYVNGMTGTANRYANSANVLNHSYVFAAKSD